MRARQKMPLLTVVFLGSMLMTGAILASALQAPTVDWDVTGGGGGRLESDNLSLDNTLGQPVVGVVSSGNMELCAGFWCRIVVQAEAAENCIYLPVVVKN